MNSLIVIHSLVNILLTFKISPSSPSSFSHLFSRKHTKSSSSDSSVTGANSTVTLQKSTSHIEGKLKTDEPKRSGGFLGKLRRKEKDRSNSKDRLYPSKSASNLLVRLQKKQN